MIFCTNTECTFEQVVDALISIRTMDDVCLNFIQIFVQIHPEMNFQMLFEWLQHRIFRVVARIVS